MALTKQAKILTPEMEEEVLNYLNSTRYPVRNRVMFLLSTKAGLRAKEIASITWSMVFDAKGSGLSQIIELDNSASKGKGGRKIPLNNALSRALGRHEAETFKPGMRLKRNLKDRIIKSERGNKVSAQTVVDTFAKWYKDLGYDGCSSHSGRRTFITNGARKISTVGGSLRDIQIMAGHSSLQTTEKYIEGNDSARFELVQLL